MSDSYLIVEFTENLVDKTLTVWLHVQYFKALPCVLSS